jgi:flagellar operon protein
MNRIGNQFSTIEQVTDRYLSSGSVNNTAKESDISFADVLKDKQTTVRFSKHASERLSSRNINLTDEQSSRLESGVDQAKNKGINESLVLVDSLAFIVNVPNRTVVTAMDQTETQSNIFTNIDGAVIM